MRGAPVEDDIASWVRDQSYLTLNGIGGFYNTARFDVRPAKIKDPELIKLINDHSRMTVQGISYIQSPKQWANICLQHWTFGITDGSQDMPFDPKVVYEDPQGQINPRVNVNQVAEYKAKFAAKGLSIMPQHGYLPAVISALSQGKILDREFCTTFETTAADSLLPCAFWYNNKFKLHVKYPYNTHGDLRCRPWVGGEKKLGR